jgi:hypothetical protein
MTMWGAADDRCPPRSSGLASRDSSERATWQHLSHISGRMQRTLTSRSGRVGPARADSAGALWSSAPMRRIGGNRVSCWLSWSRPTGHRLEVELAVPRRISWVFPTVGWDGGCGNTVGRSRSLLLGGDPERAGVRQCRAGRGYSRQRCRSVGGSG